MSEKDKVYKLQTYKKLNADATIGGFPFGVFFIVIMWLTINVFIVVSVSFVYKIVVAFIALIGMVLLITIFKKHGLKATQKYIDLFFKKVQVIKLNEQIKIKKIKIK